MTFTKMNCLNVLANSCTDQYLFFLEQYRENDQKFATKALHAGQEPEQWNSQAVIPPISLSTTFKQQGPADFAKAFKMIYTFTSSLVINHFH